MADLNFLARLGSALGGAAAVPGAAPVAGAAPVNAMQALVPGVSADAAPPAAPSPSPEPRKRSSILDSIGRVADVLARVGGAEALYQPTLDAREDREIALADHAQQVDLNKLRALQAQQQIDAGNLEATDAETARFGKAVRGLQALQAARPGVDINAAWPLLAKQAGIPDDRAAVIGQALQQNPDLLAGFAGMTGEQNLGKQVYYGRDAQGNPFAYQVGADGQFHPVALPEGASPVQGGVKTVDTGGGVATIDPLSGRPVGARILPKTEAPGRAADRASRERIAGANIASRERIAAMPARSSGKGGKADATPAKVAEAAAPVVASLKDAVERLHRSGGMTDENSGITDTANAMARESIPGYERFTNKDGYSARQDLNRLLTVGIPSLLPLMGGLSLGGKNMDAAKELETWRNAIASAKDYPSAMRAIQGFEQRISQMRAAQPAGSSGGQTQPRRRIQPQQRKPAANNGGWSVVGVK